MARNNKKIMADMDKVGSILSEAKKAGKVLSAAAANECRQVLKEASRQLFRLKVLNAKENNTILEKRAALNESIKESLIGKEEGKTETMNVSKASVSIKIRARRIAASIEAIKRLATQVNELSKTKEAVRKPVTNKIAEKRTAMRKHIADRIKAKRKAAAKKKADADPTDKTAASPRNEQLDKGVDTSQGIKAQPKVTVTAPEQSTPQNVAVDNSGIGNEAELNHQKQMEGPKPSVMSAKKARAKRMYIQASKLVTLAEAEKDATKKADLNKRALMIERMADKLVASEKTAAKQAPKRAGKVSSAFLAKRRAILAARRRRASEEKEAALPVFAANDQVLLADGVVGKVSAVNENKLTVNIAGIDKEVLADSVKKITSMKTDVAAKEACSETPKKEKKHMSIKEKVQAAAEFMRTGGKKKMAIEGEDEVPIAIADDAPAKTLEIAAESVGNTVGETESKVLNYVDGLGWTVNKTENEVVNFGEDKGAAENFVKTMAKKRAGAPKQDPILDSANVTKPESQEDTVKKLKGLDQKAKDYGSTTKDEKVNAQTSMIGKAGRQTRATALTKNSPVDSATTTPPEQVDTQKKLKGLDQTGKGYSTTTADEKIDPRFSVYARKQQILAETNRKQAARLAVVEAERVVDRAVKVGTISEEQRSGQEQVLAELYASSPSEFKAFERLVALKEANTSIKTVASRKVHQVRNSMENREPVIVEASVGAVRSLESGNFFDDEV